jgi:HAD superfamily hydrolase (TIGR01490 family)
VTSLRVNPPPGIAWFDLDGTLFAWDSQLLFRHFVLRREPWRGVFLPLFLIFLPLAGLLGDGGMKRIFLSYLWGLESARLAELAEDFAATLLPTVYPEVRAELERHRQAGHFLILASASPEFYVQEIGKALGFDLILGTQVTMGPLFPDLENHKGSAKVARLHQVLSPGYFTDGKLHNSHGYTDSRADLPMLTLCNTATVVNPSPALAALATAAQWQILSPSRPWRTRLGFILRLLALLTGLGHDPGGLRAPLGKNPASPPDTTRV